MLDIALATRHVPAGVLYMPLSLVAASLLLLLQHPLNSAGTKHTAQCPNASMLTIPQPPPPH
jgi:hypothetical protein